MLELLRNRALRLVLGMHFTFFLAVSGLLILPKWLVTLGYSESGIGVVMGLPGLASLVFTFVVGQFLDRVGRLRFIRAGLVVFGAATALLPFAVDLPVWLNLLRLVQGLAFACTFPAAATMVTDVAPPERRVQALGLFGVCTLSTQAISPLIGEWVARWLGFPVFVLATSVLCLMALWPTIALARILRRDGGAAVPPAVPLERRRHRLYWPLLIFAGFVGALFGAMLTFVPVMFLHAGADNVAPFFIGCSGAAVFVRIFFGGFGDRGDRDHIMAASGAVAIFTVALTAALGFQLDQAGPHRLLMVLIGSMFGFGVGFFYPVANARFIELGPDALRGKYMSYYSTTYATGITTASFVYGYVVELLGYGWMFAIAATLAGVALMTWLIEVCRFRRARISVRAGR